MEIIDKYGSYNHRRYGKPWAAKIILNQDGKPEYVFTGHYFGDSLGGEVVISAEIGEVVAFGQKDLRNPNHTKNNWYAVTGENEMVPVSQAEARRFLTTGELPQRTNEENEK